MLESTSTSLLRMHVQNCMHANVNRQMLLAQVHACNSDARHGYTIAYMQLGIANMPVHNCMYAIVKVGLPHGYKYVGAVVWIVAQGHMKNLPASTALLTPLASMAPNISTVSSYAGLLCVVISMIAIIVAVSTIRAACL